MLISWIAIIVAVLVLLLAMLAWMRVQITIAFSQHGSDTDGIAQVRTLFGLVRVKKQLVSVKARMTDEGPSVEANNTGTGQTREKSVITGKEIVYILRNWQQWLELVKTVWHQFTSLLQHVTVKSLRFRGSLGTGDVVYTGMAYGSAWATISSMLGWFSYRAKFASKPDVQLAANFEKAEFAFDFRCILTVRAGHLMLTAVRLVRAWRRRTSDGAPNPGTHEDGDGEHPRDGRRQHDYRRSG